MMPNFLSYSVQKKKNIKVNFEKVSLNLLNRRKINNRGKTKLFIQIWETENLNNFHNIESQ